jgi:hypothetical protein
MTDRAPIIERGRSNYQIITPRGHAHSGPSSNRQIQETGYAARQLQEALYAMTGVRLPVRNIDQRLPELPAMLVGSVERSEPEPGLWDRDSYEVLPDGADLLLRGSPGRGALYAVYAFLESLGARWYGPQDVALPRLKRVELPGAPMRSTAAFGYRHIFYPTAQVPEWALRWKLNAHDGADQRWGPNARAHSWGHSFRALVPPEKHFSAHPEYFSLVDGRRRDRGEQLCATNPMVADVACESMARWIEQNPERRIFAVAMNDWLGWCECPECAADDEREGTHMGQVLTLVNRVAERFPDRIFATLAYWWTVQPPRRVRARDNVLIVLCHNEGCFTHALTRCEHNAPFLARLKGWNEKADHILLWDYYVNYHSYLMPTPNLRRIETDLRTYREHGVEGMFCQGSAMAGGQFEGLRQYLLARLLWDPAQNAWPIVEEWTRGVYGQAAAGAILEYLAMLHDHVDDDNVHVLSFGARTEVQPDLFTPEILRRGKEMWDRAEQAAKGAALRRKVFAARAPEMCSRLFNGGMTYGVEGGRLRPEPPPDMALRDRFVQAAILGGAAHLRENDSAPERFKVNYGRSYKVCLLENDLLRAVVVPQMGGRIFSLRWKDGDIELMHVDDLVRVLNYMPCHCGYEFSVDAVWRGRGTTETYKVASRTGAGGLLLRAALKGDLTLETRYSLDGARLDIEHAVTNNASGPADLSPCTHPEWNYDAFGPRGLLEMRRQDATWATMLLNPEERSSRDLAFAGADLPAGCWRAASAIHPVAIEQTFDLAQVATARYNMSLYSRSANLELHFKPCVLQPGERAIFSTAWQFARPQT